MPTGENDGELRRGRVMRKGRGPRAGDALERCLIIELFSRSSRRISPPRRPNRRRGAVLGAVTTVPVCTRATGLSLSAELFC